VQIRLNDPCEATTDHLFIIENLIIVWSAEARNIWNSHPPALQIRTSLTPSVVNLRLSISNRASNLLGAFYSAPQIRLLLTIVCVIYLLTSTNTETCIYSIHWKFTQKPRGHLNEIGTKRKYRGP